jgi:tetratricopeptide (TPR) repeat protein
MSRAIFHGFLLLSFLFVSFNTSAQRNRDGDFGAAADSPNRGQGISGTVHTSSGAPISNAFVMIRDMRTGRVVFSGITASDGAFEASGIDPGSYEVVIRNGMDEDRRIVQTDGPASFVRVTFASPGTDQSGGEPVAMADLRAPKKAQDAFAKGHQAIMKNEVDKARKELEKALQIYPDYASALTLLAVVESTTPELSSALTYAQRATELAPESSLSHTVLASIFNRSGQFNPALKEADKAISLAPLAWQGYFERAQSLGAVGRIEEALASASRADELTQGKALQPRLLVCRILARLGRDQEARTRMNAFIQSAQDQRVRDLAKAEMVNGFTKK